jgi:hypothetical protein
MLLLSLLTFVLYLCRWNYQVAEVFGQSTIKAPVDIPLKIMNIMRI